MLDAPKVCRKRKRPSIGSPEKVVKKEKVDVPPPEVADNMISKDRVKGHISLIRNHLFTARQGEMMMRAHLARITTSLDELAKILD